MKNQLPNLPHLKNIPDYVMSYTNFLDYIENLWDNDQDVAITIMYFISNGKITENSSWYDVKDVIKELYHS